jgi:hypothetical protein
MENRKKACAISPEIGRIPVLNIHIVSPFMRFLYGSLASALYTLKSPINKTYTRGVTHSKLDSCARLSPVVASLFLFPQEFHQSLGLLAFFSELLSSFSDAFPMRCVPHYQSASLALTRLLSVRPFPFQFRVSLFFFH